MNPTHATLETILAQVIRVGVRVFEHRGEIRFQVPPGVDAAYVESLRVHGKEELVRVARSMARYRRAVHAEFRLRARGEQESPGLVDRRAALADDLGPELAQGVWGVEAARWTKKHSQCAWCGHGSEFHEAPTSCEGVRNAVRRGEIR